MSAISASSRADAADVLAGGELRYSTVWEDHLLLEHALEPRAGDELLVIASAGDNVLNLLLREPRRIVALDVNPAQSALLELQIAAISMLQYTELVGLLGFAAAASEMRLSLYDRVRERLSRTSRMWWDEHVATIAAGIARSGRLERYIAGFRETHLADAPARAAIDALLSATNLADQRAHAARVFTPEFVRAFKKYFTADSLSARGRDPSQMRYVAEDFDVSGHFLGRLQWACTELPIAGNCYVERFFRGGLHDAESRPPHLRRENLARLRQLAPRIEIVTAELEDYLASSAQGSLTHAALSDVFEYLSEDASAALFGRLSRVIRRGGRIAYWNLFVPRSGAEMSSRLRWLEALSSELWARDRAWFYRAFRVEEVIA